MKTKQQISKVLYDMDPMGTCCNENQLFDEYDAEAELIASGRSVKAVFFSRFWQNCLNNRQITKIEESINALVQTPAN
jgi:hypothetical protein